MRGAAFFSSMYPKSLLLLCCCFVSLLSHHVVQAQEECQAEGECAWNTHNSNDCGLYMAESSIPNSGWGMYTGIELQEGDIIHPMDVSVQVPDSNYHKQQIYPDFPRWLMYEYYWEAFVGRSTFDAEEVDAIMPGLGMLANSHMGLVNAENDGPTVRQQYERETPEAGAFSHYQNLTFSTNRYLPAGHELFVSYGDEWFEMRSGTFGEDLPLSDDFDRADDLLQQWKSLLNDDLDRPLAHDLYKLVKEGFGPLMSPRTSKALPENISDAIDVVSGKTTSATTAYLTVPNVVRSQEWLQKNGICLDNIHPSDSTVTQGKGAFATRFLSKDSIVAPAPVVHLSKKHMEMVWKDQNNEVLWRGRQLLLNYCYGHPSSSLIFFPYSPAVNLINHNHTHPNVAIRWSSRMSKPQLLNLTAKELVDYNSKAGLMMEIYALRDIQPGEEVLLDYGKEWEQAWEDHVSKWNKPVHANVYRRAWDYNEAEEIFTEKEENYPPSYIEVRCWVARHQLKNPDENGWHEWVQLDSDQLETTTPCRVVDAHIVDGKKESYFVTIKGQDDGDLHVKDVPWSAITFVEKAYTGNQFLRQAFRHEIVLPDDMIPADWRDLEDDDESCGLYMAESAIPNSGLGMYTAREIKEDEQIFSGDVVVQVEDKAENGRLRHWYHGEFDYDEDDVWLLHHYYWNAGTTNADFEAGDVLSIVPGLGMLANSHPGLVNADNVAPSVTADLHRGEDPGAGASTNYHNIHFLAKKNIQAGEELFVEYGDEWFAERDDLGPIPLSNDYVKADRLLEQFHKITNGNMESEVARDVWELLWNVSSEGERWKSVIPKNLKEVERVTKGGDLLLEQFRKITNGNMESELARGVWELLWDVSSEGERWKSALPRNLKDVERVMKDGTAANTVPNRVRSIEWLKKNGRCLDNIKPARSKIHQAGRGAFATRRIKKGQVIAPMPMVHIRRSDLEIYDSDDVEDEESEVWKVGTQLLLNYCYGHKESSLLMFPYSPVVNYVNHNATMFNSELRWSSISNHKKDWLKRSPDDLDSEDHAGLSMEIVATRDIEAGEEVYLNYGEDWDRAWNKYVQEWVPSDDDEDYVPAEELNRRVEWIKTKSELDREPYDAEEAMTICYIGNELNILKTGQGEENSIRKSEWRYTSPQMYKDTVHAYPCTIIGRASTVSLDEAVDRSESVRPIDVRVDALVHYEDDNLLVTGIPRKAIRFVDEKYSSDMFLRNAFRHEIQIPDHMMPAVWRDLKE